MAFVWESPTTIARRDSPANSAQNNRWVHTRTGWEKPSSWIVPPPAYEPPIHPLVLAGLQLCLSLGALIAFPAQPTANATFEEDTAE
jgi:hypothetical protein